MEVIRRTVFLRLLLPLILGIVTQYFFPLCFNWIIYPLSIGFIALFLSLNTVFSKKYKWRHLFGIGCSFIVFSIGITSTFFRQEIAFWEFKDVHEVYDGIITDIPQEKDQTIATSIETKTSGKKLLCYFHLNKGSSSLKVGDNIRFFSKIEPFQNSSDDFNYKAFMKNKGYVGYSFIDVDRWEINGNSHPDIYILANKSKDKILTFYKSLHLSKEELGLLSALTLGHKDLLPDDFINSFRTTGTAHLLAISGMHIVIIYSIIKFLICLILDRHRHQKALNTLIIILLWTYLFIIGFPASAVRACIMITFFCFSSFFNRKTYSFNTLFGCAFLMLIWNPLWLFDISFQLSFVAVLFMMLFLPKLSHFTQKKHPILKYFINILIISIVVQIGTIPFCLYYFGTFPVYFFITNLFIIPLISILIYTSVALILIAVAGTFMPSVIHLLYYLPITGFKFTTYAIQKIISFFETLPFAIINNLKIDIFSAILLSLFLIMLVYFIEKRSRSKFLIGALSCLICLFTTSLYKIYNLRNTITVTKTSEQSDIYYYIDYNKQEVTKDSENHAINLSGKSFFILSQDKWKDAKAHRYKKVIDYLLISSEEPISITSLNQAFYIKKVIIDSSIPRFHAKRITSECEKLRIPCHDISSNGTLRIFF